MGRYSEVRQEALEVLAVAQAAEEAAQRPCVRRLVPCLHKPAHAIPIAVAARLIKFETQNKFRIESDCLAGQLKELADLFINNLYDFSARQTSQGQMRKAGPQGLPQLSVVLLRDPARRNESARPVPNL